MISERRIKRLDLHYNKEEWPQDESRCHSKFVTDSLRTETCQLPLVCQRKLIVMQEARHAL